MADHDEYPFGLPEFKGITWPMPKRFAVGDAVTYTVYPNVINGLGMVTKHGVLSVGTTYMDVTAAGLSDWCDWDHIYDISPRRK